MGDPRNRFLHLHIDSKFLPEFAGEALLECLSRFAFPTRKFPQSSEMRFGIALRDQDFSASKNQPRCHFNHRAATSRSVAVGRKVSLAVHRTQRAAAVPQTTRVAKRSNSPSLCVPIVIARCSCK